MRFPISLTVKPTRKYGKQVFPGKFRHTGAIKLAKASNWKNKQLMEILFISSPVVFYTCDAGIRDRGLWFWVIFQGN